MGRGNTKLCPFMCFWKSWNWSEPRAGTSVSKATPQLSEGPYSFQLHRPQDRHGPDTVPSGVTGQSSLTCWCSSGVRNRHQVLSAMKLNSKICHPTLKLWGTCNSLLKGPSAYKQHALSPTMTPSKPFGMSSVRTLRLEEKCNPGLTPQGFKQFCYLF